VAGGFIACGGRSFLDGGGRNGEDGGMPLDGQVPSDSRAASHDGESLPDARLAIPDATSPDGQSRDAGSCTPEVPCVVALAESQFLPSSIAVNGTDVYWTNLGSGAYGSVVRVATSGGSAVTLAAGRDGPRTIALDSTYLFWHEAPMGGVFRLGLGGGSPTTLSTALAINLALDATSVYWVEGLSSGVVKLPKAGGTPTTLASWQTLTGAIAVDSTAVFLSSAGGVTMVSADGGPRTVFAAGQDAPFPIIAAGNNVGWLTYLSAAIVAKPVAGGATTTLATGATSAGGSALALDSSYAYWTTSGSGTLGVADGAVLKAPLSGGAVTTLAGGEDGPNAIAVDSTSVYWTTATAVRKRTPK
jgi:hypothetical protein